MQIKSIIRFKENYLMLDDLCNSECYNEPLNKITHTSVGDERIHAYNTVFQNNAEKNLVLF